MFSVFVLFHMKDKSISNCFKFKLWKKSWNEELNGFIYTIWWFGKIKTMIDVFWKYLSKVIFTFNVKGDWCKAIVSIFVNGELNITHID